MLTSNLTPTFIMQSMVSLIITLFCVAQLHSNEKPDQSYWIMLSSTLAYWLPSPTQSGKDGR